MGRKKHEARTASRKLLALSGAAVALSLAACEDPNNSRPVFSGPSTVTVPEGETGVVYTASAMDGNGDRIVYRLLGGADDRLLGIDRQTGEVRFRQSPDFEAPTDANGDNVYEIVIRANDGNLGITDFPLALTVTDRNEGPQRYLDPIYTELEGRTVAYGRARTTDGERTLFMDVYAPANDRASDRPVVIVAHGGSFLFGNRRGAEGLARRFAQYGYVAATIDYRLVRELPDQPNPANVWALSAAHDMFAAVRYFKDDAARNGSWRVRGDAIFTGGISAGAITALITGSLDPSDPITDQKAREFFAANGGVYGSSGGNRSLTPEVAGVISLSGALPTTDYFDNESAPFYAAHNEYDDVVPCGSLTDPNPENRGFPGPCVLTPLWATKGIPATLYLAQEPFGHVRFTSAEYDRIIKEAAALFYREAIGRD